MSLSWTEERALSGPLCRPDGSGEAGTLVGGLGLWRTFGPAFEEIEAIGAGVPIRAVSVVSRDEWWAVGPVGTFVRASGGRVEVGTVPGLQWDLTCVAAWPGKAWITAGTNEIWRFDGAWERWTPFTDLGVSSVWGPSPDRVYLKVHPRVGGRGQMAITVWDGQGFSPVAFPKKVQVHALAGQGKEVWVVGQEFKVASRRPVVFREEAGAWREVDAPLREPLHSVGVRGPGDVWIGGESGMLLHWDGKRWFDRSITGGGTLTAIHAPVGGPLRVVLDQKRILRANG
jgi:hypothetical protein